MLNEPFMLTSPVNYYEENPHDPSFKIFHYYWLYIPTGENGQRDVWMHNRKDFLEALNYWNRGKDWKYAEFFLLTKW